MTTERAILAGLVVLVFLAVVGMIVVAVGGQSEEKQR